MKYPWVSITILAIWIASALVIIGRDEVRPEYVLSLTLISTIIIGLLGFRSPK